MKKILSLLSAVLFSAFLSMPLAHAASITYSAKDHSITLSGEIVPLDAINWNRYFTKENKVQTIRLESPGGDVQTAIGIMKSIKNYGAPINTEAVGACYSACAFIWMTGTNIIVDNNIIVGAHSAYSVAENGKLSPNDYAIDGYMFALAGYSPIVVDSFINNLQPGNAPFNFETFLTSFGIAVKHKST